MGWFQKKPTPTPQTPNLPTVPVVYPAGTVVVTETGNRYLINKDGKKYRIPTYRVYQSWKFPLIVYTSDVAVSNYPTAVTKLGFRDGTLLNNIADGRLYLVTAGVLRHITSPEVMTRLGKTREDALEVSQVEIELMKRGEELN